MSVWLPSVGRHLVCCRKQLQAHAQATENLIVEGVYSTLGRGIDIDKTGSEQGVAVPSQWIMELLENVTVRVRPGTEPSNRRTGVDPRDGIPL